MRGSRLCCLTCSRPKIYGRQQVVLFNLFTAKDMWEAAGCVVQPVHGQGYVGGSRLCCLTCSLPKICVTCSHEMMVKLCHAVPSISLKTVVGVNLGEIEIFALCRSSSIFAPYTCSFLLYSTHKCFKFCK